jgi:glycosyltransferase involved in cell wall biosynthesis
MVAIKRPAAAAFVLQTLSTMPTKRSACIAKACMSSSPPRLVYLVTEDWYFVSHRLPMARAARAAGFDVHVATRVHNHGDAIVAEGFTLHPVRWRRGSLNPRHLVATVRDVRALYRELIPDVVHHVALLPIVAGSLAAAGRPIRCVNSINGLGAAFVSGSIKAMVARAGLNRTLRILLGRRHAMTLVQIAEDRDTLEAIGVDPARIEVIAGSGVDVEALTPCPEPAGPVTVAYAGRLLEYKGVRTLVAAHDLLRRRGRDIRLLIAGLPDAANPTSISEHEIEAWKRRPDIAYLGFVDDIATVWASAHIAALPSRREGVPKSLLEAAACARPIVATDVPGCRAVARADVNALLVPPDDAAALAEAIDRLAQDAHLRRRFGDAGRALVEREFASDRIGEETVWLYQRLLREL